MIISPKPSDLSQCSLCLKSHTFPKEKPHLGVKSSANGRCACLTFHVCCEGPYLLVCRADGIWGRFQPGRAEAASNQLSSRYTHKAAMGHAGKMLGFFATREPPWIEAEHIRCTKVDLSLSNHMLTYPDTVFRPIASHTHTLPWPVLLIRTRLFSFPRST